MRARTITPIPLPTYALASGCVSAGFPSPADDYVWDRLDMNEFLKVDATTSFFVRVDGACREEGILNGDILVVDKALRPCDGSLVIGIVDDECRVRRYRFEDGAGWLEDPDEGGREHGEVWGVVTGVTRTFR